MTYAFISLSDSTVKNLLWLLAMVSTDYLAVIIAVLIDLRSGTLKAKREGIPRTSRGYRRTVEKLSRYLITLLALSAVDAMIVTAALLLKSTMDWAVPVFPLFTTVGAVALALIEGKSVMENSQRRRDFTDAASEVTTLLNHKEIQKLAETLRKIIKTNDV